MDSVRQNLNYEDMVETIRLELSNDIDNRCCVVLVEGSSDMKFVKGQFNDNAIPIESISGKHTLEELLADDRIECDRVIAIRDRDYMKDEELLPRMFVYDGCCLELMLIQPKQIRDSFFVYYTGSKTKNQYILHYLQILSPFSVLRKYNEENACGINFDFGLVDLLDESENLDVSSLFTRARQNADILSMCQNKSDQLQVSDLWDVTNGHDLYRLLAKNCKLSKKTLNEDDVRMIVLSLFRNVEFCNTQLYQNLMSYQSARNFDILTKSLEEGDEYDPVG